MTPANNGQAAQNKTPECEPGGQPFGFQIVFFFKTDSLPHNINKMKSGQPGQKQKKNNVSADHLGLFRVRNRRAEGDAEGGGWNIETQNT